MTETLSAADVTFEPVPVMSTPKSLFPVLLPPLPDDGDGTAEPRCLDDAPTLNLDPGVRGPRRSALALERHGSCGALDGDSIDRDTDEVARSRAGVVADRVRLPEPPAVTFASSEHRPA